MNKSAGHARPAPREDDKTKYWVPGLLGCHWASEAVDQSSGDAYVVLRATEEAGVDEVGGEADADRLGDVEIDAAAKAIAKHGFALGDGILHHGRRDSGQHCADLSGGYSCRQ